MTEGHTSEGRQRNSTSYWPMSVEILKGIFEIYVDTPTPSIQRWESSLCLTAASRSSIRWNCLVQIEVVFTRLALLATFVTQCCLPFVPTPTPQGRTEAWQALAPWVLLSKVNFRSHWKNAGMLTPLLCFLYIYFFFLFKTPHQNNEKNLERASFISMKFRFFLSIKKKFMIISLSRNQSIFENSITAASIEDVKLPTDFSLNAIYF